MLRTRAFVIPALVLAAVLTVHGQAAPAAQAAAPAPPMAIKQVKPGLYMVTGFGGNSTVRVTDQGVILVDTKNLGDAFYNGCVKFLGVEGIKIALAGTLLPGIWAVLAKLRA